MHGTGSAPVRLRVREERHLTVEIYEESTEDQWTMHFPVHSIEEAVRLVKGVYASCNPRQYCEGWRPGDAVPSLSRVRISVPGLGSHVVQAVEIGTKYLEQVEAGW